MNAQIRRSGELENWRTVCGLSRNDRRENKYDKK